VIRAAFWALVKVVAWLFSAWDIVGVSFMLALGLLAEE